MILNYILTNIDTRKQRKNNSIALNGDDSNKELIADTVTIQITLLMVTYLFTIAYRITVKLLSV